MLKALIVDDEGPARKRLARLLAPMIESGRVTIEGEARDGVEALAALNEKRYDILFLDVQMPELTGFDVLERVPEDRRPVVIFTTAYDEYAVKAFEANAIDYLLKPIDKKRLDQAVGRAERLVGTPEERAEDDTRFNVLLDWMDEQAGTAEGGRKLNENDYLKQLSVPYRDRLVIVPVERIILYALREQALHHLRPCEARSHAPAPRREQQPRSATIPIPKPP